MTLRISSLKKSGTKSWAVVTADTLHELEQVAGRTGAEIHQKGGQSPHLDLNLKQIKRIRQK